MFVNFFLELRQAKVPVSLREYLTLMEAMKLGVADYSVEDFYYLSRRNGCASSARGTSPRKRSGRSRRSAAGTD